MLSWGNYILLLLALVLVVFNFIGQDQIEKYNSWPFLIIQVQRFPMMKLRFFLKSEFRLCVGNFLKTYAWRGLEHLFLHLDLFLNLLLSHLPEVLLVCALDF